jgi:preprotein translocase subunit SecD
LRAARREFLATLTAAAAMLAASASAQEDAPPPALSFEAGSAREDFSAEDIWAVTVHPGALPGGVNLEVTLTGEAKDRFARFTAVHVGRPTAVYLGGEFLMEAIIQAPITGGRMALPFADQPSAAAAMDTLLGRN